MSIVTARRQLHKFGDRDEVMPEILPRATRPPELRSAAKPPALPADTARTGTT